MTSGPNIHTMEAMLQNWRDRLVSVERRLARTGGLSTLPDRLSPTGKQVIDWNDAIETGFYWSIGAANGPIPVDKAVAGAGDWFTGIVTYHPGPTPRYMQQVREARTGPQAVVYYRYWNSSSWTAWMTQGSKITDWDTVFLPGQYFATGAANAPTSDFYTGTVEWDGDHGRAIQFLHVATSTVARQIEEWRRTYDGAAWGTWVAIGRQALNADLTDLGTVDLNTILETGWRVQVSNANATAARNYPAARAGHLQTQWTSASSDFCVQTYTDYQNTAQYTRTYNNGTWLPWKLAVMGRGTVSQRGTVFTPGYWDFWQDTDSAQTLWVGSRSATWRQFSGTMTFASAAWDTTGGSGAGTVVGRTITATVPTVLETNENLIIQSVGVGSGFGFIGVNPMVRNASNTTAVIRFMQIAAATTQALTIQWQISQT